ncbi:DinB family protein [Paenibacillus curdlanolyticus YK9]|uniref:DinB family protein n=1 Tax=Paenibacillus curdlanolyticus YK9 TaxID=717606 RepID=E0I9R0_9BACL|nr:DinB family protein [Paenibacillus curdlanolyticus]EFM11144.1 DinB family protein [Paenibacillus curdlanolyticus YK9]
MNHCVKMYDYHVWANKTIFNRLKELPEHLYNQEIQSVFPSISKLMAHIYKVDFGWFNILKGQEMSEAMTDSFRIEAEAETKSLTELEAMYDSLAARFKAYIVAHPNLENDVVLHNPYAGVLHTRYSEFVIQVANHGTYHRGNLSAMLRQLGHSSVMTEYGLFMHLPHESSTSAVTAHG